MKRICAWCKKMIGKTESDPGKVTHGCCRECNLKVREQIEQLKAIRNDENNPSPHAGQRY